MTPEERKVNEQGLLALNEQTNSIFYFEPIPEIEKARELFVYANENEFQAYLKSRPNRIFCMECSNGAEFIERMKTDSQYKRPICTQCRNHQIKRRYDKMMKKQTTRVIGTKKP